jgi:hypothetical protein
VIDSATGLVNGVGTGGTSTITYMLSTSCITTVVVTVNPTPAAPHITTETPNSICSDTYFQNFGTDIAPDSSEYYSWSATNGEVMAAGYANQYCIINFTTPGASVVTLTATEKNTGCTSTNNYSLNVEGTTSNNALVVYTNSMFVCLLNNVSAYQWGYDDVTTLDSSRIDGQINQTYLNTSPDWAHKYYWVMTTDLTTGCVKKAYYNAPATGVANVNNANSAHLELYPNPADAQVNVEILGALSGNYTLEVYNVLGQKVTTVQMADHKATIDIEGFTPGCYMVVCTENGNKFATARFIKN